VVSLSQIVLKVHSRCDLACDHCYVYEAADQSWRDRPGGIPDDVIRQAAQRIAEHAASHALPAVQVILHGGEPLLAGGTRLRRVITALQSALGGVCDLDLRIHTNGVQLDEHLCELFAEHGVRVGVSLDGDRTANDRHRRYANGRSSYDKVTQAIGLLRSDRFRHLYAGLLCTIDIANDPLVVYESLKDLQPPRIDFLLPHATWDHPPLRNRGADTEYADWLAVIFDRWVAEGQPLRIRTFDSILSTLRGGGSLTESLGLDPVDLVVIEADGGYEQVDSLKVAFDGAPETGMNVFDHSLDLVGQHPGIVARQKGIAGLCRACRECPVVNSCGGGLYTHRYRTETGFDNPSVYCADLLALISHVSSHLPEEPAGSAGITVHAMNDTDFRALASGAGDAAAIGRLIEGQRSLLRGLLGAVHQAATNTTTVPAADQARLREAWDLLAAIEREQSAALDDVLGHPYLRVWAVRCLEELNLAAEANGDGQDRNAEGQVAWDLSAGLGHLGAVAAAAAARAGMEAEVSVPLVRGCVHLPTLGRLILGPDEGEGPAAGEPEMARISVSTNAVTVTVGGSCWTLDRAALSDGTSCAAAVPGNRRSGTVPGNRRSGTWQPVRMLKAGGLYVALDDTDPYRDCGLWPAAPRLTDAEASQWERDFRAAWREIEREHEGYLPALAAGLTTLTPLTAVPDGHEASSVARRAFGAVAASAPATPGRLALCLIQEFQRAKLGAVLDLYDLYDPADNRLLPTPWGEGKCRIEALLQAAYAHLAVTDFWRVRAQDAVGAAAGTAEGRFRECQAKTDEAIGTLLGSSALTSLGARFVQEMGRTMSAFTRPARG
jgi:uncharacterized protein